MCFIYYYCFYITILMEVFFYKVYIIFGNYSRLRLLPFKKKNGNMRFQQGKNVSKIVKI